MEMLTISGNSVSIKKLSVTPENVDCHLNGIASICWFMYEKLGHMCDIFESVAIEL